MKAFIGGTECQSLPEKKSSCRILLSIVCHDRWKAEKTPKCTVLVSIYFSGKAICNNGNFERPSSRVH